MTEAEPRRVPWWQIVTVGRNPKVTLIRLLVLVVLTFFTLRYLCLPVRVTGISMSPTYRDGQRRFVNRAALWTREPQRGDVVAVRTTGMSILYMKRVIGLPGERVRIVRGQVMIDGEAFEEPYVLNRAPWNWPRDGSERTLASDEYLLIGDNRGMSQDSHDFGVAKRNKIIGRVIQ